MWESYFCCLKLIIYIYFSIYLLVEDGFRSFVELPAPESVELFESLGEVLDKRSSLTWNFTTYICR